MVQRVGIRDYRVVIIDQKTKAICREIAAHLASDVAAAIAEGFNRAEVAHPLGVEARVTLSETVGPIPEPKKDTVAPNEGTDTRLSRRLQGAQKSD